MSKSEKGPEPYKKTTEYKLGQIDALQDASLRVTKLGIEEADRIIAEEGDPVTAKAILDFSTKASRVVSQGHQGENST